ncbi:MAG: LUD domain-containing protein [Bacillota bacterium]|nr:LUD domain-containing protein [Bacillota bacterium]
MTGAELLESFRSRWEGLGGQAFLAQEGVEGVRAACREAVRCLAPPPEAAPGSGMPLALLWDDPELEVLRLDEVLEAAGFRAFLWRAEAGEEEPGQAAARLRGIAARAALGVTGAAWAVAETGTLALYSGRGTGRLVSLLPPAHLAVLRRSRLVATVGEGFRMLAGEEARRGDLPSAVNLVSGPSMSADIEGELTTGVHGPARVAVVIGEW